MINLHKYGTRPGSNSRPLDLQSDLHLLPETLQTSLRSPFNDNIYHEGKNSKMPDFDVFSVLECKKHKSTSHG